MDVEQYDHRDVEDDNLHFYYDDDSAHYLLKDQADFDYYADDDFGPPIGDEFSSDEPDFYSLLRSLWTDCTLPIFSQSFLSSSALILLSAVLPAARILRCPQLFLHLLSALLGLTASGIFFPDSWQLLAAIGLGSGSLLLFSRRVFPASGRSRTAFVSAALLATAVHFELTIDDAKWHTMRGPAQLVAMKVISLSMDAESPVTLELFGYIFCPGNVTRGI